MAETPTTLRVFFDELPDPGRDVTWTLFDAAGEAIREDRSPPSGWPSAPRREAVVAARHGRLVTLNVPPLPPGRAEAAARFALEDQLAESPEDSHIAVGTQRNDGRLRVAVVARSWMSAFDSASRRCGVAWNRIILESDLAPSPARTWRWCASSVTESGFVRTDRGMTIAVGPARGDGPPEELALALSRAGIDAPQTVRVDARGASPALLARARAETGVEFAAGTPWHWSAAKPADFAAAIDLASDRAGTAASHSAVEIRRLVRPALWIAAIAVGIHVVATLGNWLWLRLEIATIDRELASLARAAVPGFTESSADSAALALSRRERDLKHRSGLAAADDFLPLLARAAPALSTLPAGAVRSLAYADGHLVFDLQKIDPPQATRLQRELQRAGLVAIAAPTANGARLRVGLT
jgi:type II secretion system protein L